MPVATTVYRIVVAKPGLDGHDRGARVLARAMRDAGFEVIYTGLHQTPEMIAATCRQEDADVLCLSILSGAHMTLLPRILCVLRDSGMADTPVLAGGIIPEADAVELKQQGIREVYGPGTDTHVVAERVQELAAERRARLEGR